MPISGAASRASFSDTTPKSTAGVASSPGGADVRSGLTSNVETSAFVSGIAVFAHSSSASSFCSRARMLFIVSRGAAGRAYSAPRAFEMPTLPSNASSSSSEEVSIRSAHRRRGETNECSRREGCPEEHDVQRLDGRGSLAPEGGAPWVNGASPRAGAAPFAAAVNLSRDCCRGWSDCCRGSLADGCDVWAGCCFCEGPGQRCSGLHSPCCRCDCGCGCVCCCCCSCGCGRGCCECGCSICGFC
mmetsp:Transcript_19545/g.56033  ORF Transcript_19545/g.56033 Transcript_19545/m.56033 type:complete len:244 (+) Transcript_19545:438-1169(+)